MFHGSYVYCVNLDFSTPIRFISPTLSFMNLFYPAVKSAGHFCYLAKKKKPKTQSIITRPAAGSLETLYTTTNVNNL